MTVLKSENTNSAVIPSLRKFTEYEFFLMPFYKMLEGQPSNSMHVQTLEDVPSAPPDMVEVMMMIVIVMMITNDDDNDRL